MRPVRLLFLVGGLFFGALLLVALLLALARMDLVVAGAGVLEPLNWRYITPEARGIVKEVLKGPGDSVAEGEVIARLDASDAVKRLEQAQMLLAEAEKDEAVAVQQFEYLKERRRNAALELANFSFEREKAGKRLDSAVAARKKAEAAAANAEKALAAAKLRHEEAIREHEDQKKLAAAGLASERLVERARVAAELQRIGVDTAVNDLEAARQELDARKAAEAIARADLDGLSEVALKNALDAADFDMKRAALVLEQAASKRARLASERDRIARQVDTYTIRAPMTGVIQKLYLFEGELSGTEPGGTVNPVVGLIAADDRFSFVMTPPPLDVIKVRRGQEVEVRLDAYPYRRYGTFRGEVSSVQRSTAQEGQFVVKVRLDSSIYPVQSGMSGYGRIIVGRVNVLSYMLGFSEDEELKRLREKADRTGSATVPFEKTPHASEK